MAIIVHNPDDKNNMSVCPELWKRHLRAIFYLIQSEIQNLNGQKSLFDRDQSICKTFVILGASVCSVASFLFVNSPSFFFNLKYFIFVFKLFWNMSLWTVENQSAGEPNKKRQKCRSEKLQGVMDLVEYEKGEFNWRWLVDLKLFSFYVIFNHLLLGLQY